MSVWAQRCRLRPAESETVPPAVISLAVWAGPDDDDEDEEDDLDRKGGGGGGDIDPNDDEGGYDDEDDDDEGDTLWASQVALVPAAGGPCGILA